MPLIRLTSRRLLVGLVVASFVFTILGIRSLQNTTSNSNGVFKFEQRVIFPDSIPGAPIVVNSESNGGKNVPFIPGTKILNSTTTLIYRHVGEASPKSDTIPRIIHQTWSTYNIPKSLVNWVKSFIHHNPEYEYWFWTDDDARNLVEKRYPEYLDIYDKYPKSIQRADVMRYFVLHEFGGFYSDMDISALKSLESLRHHSCIVSQEPWVHAKVYWGREKLLPCNAFLASAPNHPFMKMLITTIPRNYHGNNVDDVMDKTGPMMVYRILDEYEKAKAGNFRDFDRVFLAEPNLFHPRYDPNLRSKFINGCLNPEKYHLNPEEMEECAQAKERGYQFVMPREAYTDHHWMHYWIGGIFVRKIKPSNFIHIKDVVPNMKNVSEILRRVK